jgi:glucose/arabinose dehydrogenase/N-acetylneuraminic acid mutarotase
MASAIGLVAVVGSVAFAAPAASAEGCTPMPLPCSEILVDLPYTLDFASDHGKVADRDGVGTGFTYVDPPTNGTGYIPDNLFADNPAGLLRVTTTAGLNLQDVNSLDNALAVGIDAPSQVTRVEATVDDPPAGTGQNQQAGVWFGNDEDNFVKLVAVSRTISGTVGTQIEYRLEEGSVSGSDLIIRSPVLDLTGKSVTLSLIVDPGAGSIEASYRVDGGAPVTLGSFFPPPQFFSFDGARIDPEIGTDSFGGILASHRSGPAPVEYDFDSFSVTKERDVVPPPPTVLPGGIAFKKEFSFVENPTSMVFGPDGRLYVSELFGTIHALTLGEDKTAVSDEVIDTLGTRLTLGLAIDPASTADNVILWASHSSPSLFTGAPNTSVVSRLSGPGLATKEDVITGLPRAIANHATNSIHFGPDGKLYIAQGGNTGAGAPSNDPGEFGDMQEQPLSAALLVADVNSPTFDGSCDNTGDIYGPPPCDVMTYSTGLRNMYDFVFHSNGSMYGPDNATGVDGTFPPSPSPPCLGTADNALWNADPPGQNPGPQPDILVRLQQGRYYGHPDPHRDECVFKDGSYQGVAPLPNYEPPIADLGGHRSANGIIEYTSDAHCGALKGNLLIANYSVGDDLTRVELSEDGHSVLRTSSIIGGFNEPLSLAQDQDGTIYVGEFSSGTVTALVPVDVGCWTERQSAPAELLDAGGAAVGGKLYSVAGEQAGGHITDTYIYDPATDSWATGPDLPGPGVENPAAVGLDGKLYVFGGSTSSFSGAVSNAAVFDPQTNEWTALPDLPTARGGATAQAINGKIYVVGGIGADGSALATVEVFDPDVGEDGEWSTGTPLGTRRDNAGSAVLGGKLYVFGGGIHDPSGYTTPRLNSVEMYDPATETWVERAPMPTARRTMAVGTLNGRAQLIGGERKGTNEAFPENEEYDPAADSWRLLTPMRTPRHGAAAGTIGDTIYVAQGGKLAGTQFSSVNEAFAFKDQVPPATPTITDTDPDSPADDNSPEVMGSAEAGSTVKLYSDPTCTGAVLATDGAANFASPGLTPSPALIDNTTTEFRVTATDAADNISACSAPFAYVEKSSVTGPGNPARCRGKLATIVGTPGDDELVGTNGADVIAGLGGADSIGGRGGKDRICGHRGRDNLIGGPGGDVLFGGDGNDVLRGGPGRDRLEGGKGSEVLVGGPGTDVCKGGLGPGPYGPRRCAGDVG